MPVTRRTNPDGSVTIIDNSTGASRTIKGNTVVSQNYKDPVSQQSGIKYDTGPSGYDATDSVRAYNESIGNTSSSRSSSKSSSGSSAGFDFDRMLADALAQQQRGYQDDISALQRLIDQMRPQIPPEINLNQAMQSALSALEPLLESSRQQITRDSDAYQRALQSQIAQSGVYGDRANQSLAEAERMRQEAMGNLSAQAQAQIANQAMQLLGLEQGRYSSQQAANTNMAQLALALGQAAFGQENARIQNLLSMLSTQGQLGLGREGLDVQRQIAAMPYQNASVAQLLEFLLGLRAQGSGSALR